MQVSKNLQQSYSHQYDVSIEKWRGISAEYKALNIISITKGLSFKNVLEVGAGEGSILSYLSNAGFSTNMSCVEISQSGIDAISKRKIDHLKEIFLFDGYTLPYDDNHFDLIICSHVMEHVEHERVLLREIRRVSKYQVFEVPIDFSLYIDTKLAWYLSYGHINIYTPSLFRFLLRSENFLVQKDKNYLYSDRILKYTYKNNRSGYIKMKLRQMVLKLIPYLNGIKPNSYVVLTSSQKAGLNIFENTMN